MNQYYLLQIYGNPISIEYFKNNMSEDLAYEITTRFPSWRVKIVISENIELKLIIKKIIATESKIESLKNKMSQDYTVYYKNKEHFVSIIDFDDNDTHEYIYELESTDTPMPESPKNQKNKIDNEKISTTTKNIHNKYNLLQTFYHLIVIISIVYINNYVL